MTSANGEEIDYWEKHNVLVIPSIMFQETTEDVWDFIILWQDVSG